MSDVEDEGGDPACWLHLFEEEGDVEDGDETEATPEDAAADRSGLESGHGDPSRDRPAT